MNAKELPARPNVEQHKKQAKELLKSCKAGDPEAIRRLKTHHLRFINLPDSEIAHVKIVLADAHLVIAREHGFESWPKFTKHIQHLSLEKSVAAISDPLAEFIVAASVPRDGSWHASGTLEWAEAILAAHPEVARGNIYAAAILGDDAAVTRFLALDPADATAQGGPHEWDALTYLCFSKYLKLDRARSDGFVRSAKALLDAGADPNGGWFEKDHQPEPIKECVLYGAAGVAHHAELTRLLLEYGADPNDGETPYHTPESYDNAALKVLVESGKLNDDNLAMLLIRKADWHDYEGMKWLLEHGVNPNHAARWGHTAMHHSVLRDNGKNIVQVLLDHGADPTIVSHRSRANKIVEEGKSVIALAARRGRGDLLELFERRGFSIELQGVEQLIAACARNDSASVRAIAGSDPALVGELLKEGGTLLAEFAATANASGVKQLLDLGVPVTALYGGDGYFDIAANSTALHVAAWKAWNEVVKLLIERGAPVNALDGKGRTALALAVKACVDSYWANRRTPDSVAALLRAGAQLDGVEYPSGYEEVDELLREFGAVA
jgi:ankyrin repeat protein